MGSIESNIIKIKKIMPEKRKLKNNKDACYRKVKASYKVFPSAYASGAIAKCRKRRAGKKKNEERRQRVQRSSVGSKRSGLTRMANQKDQRSEVQTQQTSFKENMEGRW